MPFDVSGLTPAASPKLDTSKLTPAQPKLDVSALKPAEKPKGFIDKVLDANSAFYDRVGKAELAGAKQVGEGADKLIPSEETMDITPTVKGVLDIGAGVGRVLASPVEAAAKPIAQMAGAKDPDKAAEASSNLVQDMLGLRAAAKGVMGSSRAVGTLEDIPKGTTTETIEHAAIQEPTGVEVGTHHDAVRDKMPKKQSAAATEGFVTSSGKFVDRKEGTAIAQKAGQIEPSEVPNVADSGELHSEDVKGLNPDRVSDDLFKLSNAVKADRIEFRDKLKVIDKVPSATWEKLYAYEEDPKSIALTPDEAQLYNEHIAPLAKESRENLNYLKGKGYQLGDALEENTGYTPRQVKGKGGPVDALKGEKPAVGRKSLSKEATSTRPRSMFVAEGPNGNRSVVYVADGEVFDAKTKAPVGTIEPDAKSVGDGTPIQTADNKRLTLRQAKTGEIEAATDLEYHKNLLGNRVTNTLQLRRARRNAEFLENLKKDPRITDIAHGPKSKGQVPEDWREVPNLPQFRGYRFKPEFAEVFDDFVKNAKTPEQLAGALYKVGRLAKASLFYNPLPHAFNVGNHYFVSKGLVGSLREVPSMFRNGAKAARAVMSQDKVYQNYLRSGASLPGADSAAEAMQKELMRAMGEDMKRNPKGFAELAQAFGYANPVNWIKGVYRASSKALWSFSDMVSMTRIMELEEQGLSRAEAIKEAESGVPNYRVPSRVAGSRTASEALQNPALSMFGRYQYGRIKAYADTVKKLTTKKDFLKGADQVAMMGLLLSVYYPLLDKAAQSMTGNKDASVSASGAMAPIKSGMDVIAGKKTPGQFVGSVFSPGLVAAPAELIANTRLGTGQDIYQPQDVTDGRFGRVGYDVGKFGIEQFAPIAQALSMVEGKTTPEAFGYSQVGIKDPTDKQINGQEYAKYIRKKKQAAAAAKRGF